MLVKYSNIVVEIQSYAGGFRFYSPYDLKWIEVDGDVLHCKNRIHQHLHLEHKVPLGTVEDYPMPENKEG